ncbi:hypothetical protein B566_EDAN006459 [Ephemera danica]|nr:hypothetical protein B566_EDAN006459 [Ephemera danica]
MSSKYVAATPSLATPTVTHSSWPVLPSDRPPDRQGDSAVPEQRFWIVTVVEEEDQRRAPDTSLLEVGLARLYATAFKRVMSRRRRVATDVEPLTSVHVRVHNVSEGEPRRVQLVYSVHVRGRPVLARAAVHDMRLVSDAEVAHELGGLSIVTKAEPYLKEKEQAAWTPFSTSPWVLAGGAISAVALLALVLILLLLATTRHKRVRRIAGREQEGRGGTTNASFEPDEPRASSDRGSVSAASDTKMLPSEEGDWGVDSESLGDEIPPPSAGQAEAAIAAAVAAARSRSAGVSSPSSYLSMPSVRRFPRGGNIPEPLSQVLQQGGDVRGCLSMRNLDLYPDETAFEPRPGVSTPPPPVPRSPWGARHGSLDGEDPGVIGPCVYQMARGAGPARRRFHELLDDAFSLFGGRSDEDRSPTPPPRPPRVSEPESPPLRPKTSEPRRAAMQHPRRSQAPPAESPAGRVGSAGPRGAWETPVEGSNLRPLSAGPFHRPRLPEASKPPPYRVTPRISTERILCDAELPPTDPAVPLINAIKDELQRLQSCTSCATTPLPVLFFEKMRHEEVELLVQTF